jgi:single-strand DNA-binding protein
MASYNRVIFVGNLTRDPELKQVGAGNVCRLSIASNRQFKNKMGVMQQEVCYIDVDVWGAQAETSRQYLQKGRAVLIEGRLKLDSWKDADGQTRSKHSIVADRVVFLSSGQGAELSSSDGLMEPAEETQKVAAAPRQKRAAKKDEPAAMVFEDAAPFEDDLPF